MKTLGRSLQLYFIDGDPAGMLTAELFNWTGHVLMAPRTRIREALSRPEAAYTGVYLLLGEIQGEATVYIGEAENIARRIGQHDLAKDWWTEAVIIVSAANNLHKAHAGYLEARLIEAASQVGRYNLDNKSRPGRASLSEVDTANMEAFFENILTILPALRIDGFIKKTRQTRRVQDDRIPGDPAFQLYQRKNEILAEAILSDGEFVVSKGSHARRQWLGVKSNYQFLFNELVRTGLLKQFDEERNVFTENYAFSSPSAAAAVILGRSANGTTEWKIKDSDKTYKDWEASQLAEEITP